jgi:ATP synthase F1 complex assembly factor 2
MKTSRVKNLYFNNTKLFYLIKPKFFNTGSSPNISIPMKLKKKFYKCVELLQLKNENFVVENKNSQKNKSSDFFNFSNPSENYYHILLDKKKCKSMYQDEYIIPNEKLALILAEEWARQKDFVNLHSMHMNYYASSGIRISKDESLKTDVVQTLCNYIDSDQLCYFDKKIVEYILREEGEHLENLRKKIFELIEEMFKVNYQVFDENILSITTSKSNRENFKSIIKDFDPWVLALLESLVGLTKSPGISIGLLADLITPKQAYLLSHLEEYYQMKNNGEVEGHHDISNEFILGKLHSAYCFYNLSIL